MHLAGKTFGTCVISAGASHKTSRKDCGENNLSKGIRHLLTQISSESCIQDGHLGLIIRVISLGPGVSPQWSSTKGRKAIYLTIRRIH